MNQPNRISRPPIKDDSSSKIGRKNSDSVADSKGKWFKIFAFTMLTSPFFSSAILLILFSDVRPFPVLVLSIVLLIILITLYLVNLRIRLRHKQLIDEMDDNSITVFE